MLVQGKKRKKKKRLSDTGRQFSVPRKNSMKPCSSAQTSPPLSLMRPTMHKDTIKMTMWNIMLCCKNALSQNNMHKKNGIDVMCLQKLMHRDLSYLKLGGHQAFNVPRVPARPALTRGLITLCQKITTNQSCQPPPLSDTAVIPLPVITDISDKRGNTNLRTVNAYDKDGALNLQHMEAYANNHITILAGNLNAVHSTLRRNKTKRDNHNEQKLSRWLTNARLNITNTDNRFHAHIKGNKLDYIIIINDINLTSDHYVVTVLIQAPPLGRMNYKYERG